MGHLFLMNQRNYSHLTKYLVRWVCLSQLPMQWDYKVCLTWVFRSWRLYLINELIFIVKGIKDINWTLLSVTFFHPPIFHHWKNSEKALVGFQHVILVFSVFKNCKKVNFFLLYHTACGAFQQQQKIGYINIYNLLK